MPPGSLPMMTHRATGTNDRLAGTITLATADALLPRRVPASGSATAGTGRETECRPSTFTIPRRRRVPIRTPAGRQDRVTSGSATGLLPVPAGAAGQQHGRARPGRTSGGAVPVPGPWGSDRECRSGKRGVAIHIYMCEFRGDAGGGRDPGRMRSLRCGGGVVPLRPVAGWRWVGRDRWSLSLIVVVGVREMVVRVEPDRGRTGSVTRAPPILASIHANRHHEGDTLEAEGSNPRSQGLSEVSGWPTDPDFLLSKHDVGQVW